MVDMHDRNYCPSLNEFNEYIYNPLFMTFYSELKEKYVCKEKIEFSSCSWEYGWNLMLKKGSKTICTIYLRKGYFTILAVANEKHSEAIEKLLQGSTSELKNIYHQTKAGNGQRWLMIDLEDHDLLYYDVLRLLDIRMS